ncbi:DUF6862 domain-containing protein [Aliiroseovarius crassostreae]|uniref:DUF6862 domain-containing protein n=1 Tax=Aliiroseovarius crassostreae TaxID=154981 RepID=UPI003C7BC5CF
MTLDGIVSARDGIDITSTTGDISILGEVATNGALALTSAQDLSMGSSATLVSVENGLAVTSAGTLRTDGTVFGQTGATLTGDRLDLRGNVQTGGRLDLRAQTGGLVSFADVVAGFIDAKSEAAMQLGGSLSGPIVATATGALTVTGDIDVVRPADADPSFVTGAYLTGASVDIASGAKVTSDQLVVLEATTGRVQNAGRVTAGSSAQVTAAGAVTNSGQLLADETLVINAGSLTTTATGKSQADQIALSIGGNAVNAGAFRAQTLLDASIGGRLTNSGRIETAAGNSQISADDLRNSGQIKSHGGTTFLTDLTGFNNAGGTIFGEDGVVLEALSHLTLGAGAWGKVVSENTVSLMGKDGGYLPGLTVNAGAKLVNEGKLIIKARAINNSGTIASATDAVTLLAQGNLTNRGLIYAGGAALVIGASGNVYNRGGSILANHDLLIAGLKIHDDVSEWASFSPSEKTFLPQGDVFGTIEAGGSINGNVTGTVSNWAVGANKSGLFGTGNTRPDVDPRLPGGPAAKLALASAQGQAITSLSKLSSATLGGLSAGNLVLHPLDPNSISGWGAGGNVSDGFTRLIGSIDFKSFGNNQLFRLNRPTLGGYLVETRHGFIDRKSFISSDYFLKTLNYDPAKTQTRFGDALAETYLIRDQIYDLTGRRLLPGAKTEKDQIRAMYDNAVDASKSLGLTVGTALSPQQISRLTEDIVWLEERVVSGQKVLVPQIYLAGSAGLIRKTPGATFTAQDISLKVGDLANLGGAFQTSGDLVIAAASDITNQFGEMIAGGALSLSSELGQVSLQSGLLSGGSVGIRANEILIETVSERFGTPDNHRTDIGRVASIRSGGVLSLVGAGDISVSGASLVATDDLSIFAGGDIDIGSVLNSSALRVGDQKNGLNIARRTHINSLIQSKDGSVSIVSAQTEERDGATRLTGGGDITLSGTTVLAHDTVDIAALAGNVTLSAVLDTGYFESHSSKQYGLFGINKKQTHTEKLSATWTGNTIEAGQVSISAAGNVVDQASTLLAKTGDLDLTAQSGSVHSLSVTDLEASKTKVHKSTFWGLMDWSTEVNSLKSTAQSIEATAAKDLRLTAGQDIVIEGGRLTGENVIFDAQNVALIATVDTDYTETITHSNFGVIVVDTHQVDAVQTAGFTEINGKADFGEAPVYVDLQQSQAALIHAIPALLAPEGEDAVRMALVDHYLPEANGPPTAGVDPIAAAIQAAFTPKSGGSDDADGADGDDSDEPSPNDFSNSTFSVPVPGTLDGAGFAYLDQLFAADQLTVAEMELVNHHFYDKTTQLGVVGHLLLAYFTGGMFAEGAIFANVQGAVQQAIVRSLVTTSVNGIVSGEFDLGQALTSAFTAGIGAWAGTFKLATALGLGEGASLGLLSKGGDLTAAAIVNTLGTSAINAGITAALTGEDFFDTFLTSFASGVVSLATADLQELIGHEFAGGANGGEGSLGHALTHAGLGCIAAELQGSTCAAGAASGAASALFAGYIKGNSELDGNDFIDEAHLIAGLAAALTGADTTATLTAAGIGQSAFVNNYLNHAEEERRQALEEQLRSPECAEGACPALEAELLALDELDAARDIALQQACWGDPYSSACGAAILDLKAAVDSYAGWWVLGEESGQVVEQWAVIKNDGYTQLWAQAMLEMPVDAVTGAIDLATIMGAAALGDETAQLQLRALAQTVKETVLDPAGAIDQAGADWVNEYDQLVAEGRHQEADLMLIRLGAGITTAGASTAAGGVATLGKSIKILVPEGGDVINATNRTLPDGYRLIDDTTNAARPTLAGGNRWVIDNDGNAIIQRPDGTFARTQADIDDIVLPSAPNRTVTVDTSGATRGTPEYETLNNPPANTRVELDNGTAFRTNESGYIEEITYTPVNQRGVRDSRQTAVGREGIAGDVGGHIQACRHGGTCDRFNLFPQNSNFNSSPYRRWENEITRSLQNGDTVGAITVRFDRSNPSSARPDSLTIEYSINGQARTREFENVAGGGQ